MTEIRNSTPITAEALKTIVHYDPETGAFYGTSGRSAGKILGSLNEKGHRRIRIGSRKYYAARLAWLYVTGEWPVAMIDHRNGAPDDNRFANLRPAEAWQNSANTRNRRVSKHGLRGGRKQAKGDGWQAQIAHLGRAYTLGTFPTKEAAHAAYEAEAKRLRGEFYAGESDPLPPKPIAPEMIHVERPRLPDISKVKERLAYDPETGIFTRKITTARRGIAGSVAGSMNPYGYMIIGVCGRMILAHRIAWAIVHNEWPEMWIDHINGVRHDNRIINLRLATPSQNAMNGPAYAASGMKGAYRTDRGKPWRSWITVGGTRINLGRFDTAAEAHAAYAAAARQYFGEFARAA